MSTLYSQIFIITKKEIEDLLKIASSSTSTSSEYVNSKGQKFTVADVVMGKVSGEDAKAVKTAGHASEVSSKDWGMNIRDAS